MWMKIVEWWRSFFGDPTHTLAESDRPSAIEVMDEIRRARAAHTPSPVTRSGRPRSLRTPLTTPPAPSREPKGEVPWFERQRRQAAVRDDLRDDYDEYSG